MNSKMLVGGIIGGIAFFLLGYLLYGLAFKEAMAACTSCQRPMEEINFPLLGIGNIVMGWFIAYIYSKWTSISTFTGGATAGAVLGLILSVGMNCIMYATSTMYTAMTCLIYHLLITVVSWAIVGGLIGWWMGRK
ncbi:MAG TPA: hypothetical protein VJ508_11215 [Saprospiraceae bacterium]|nr:hypothetical protein [Saprospiraceae bacterium]